MSLKEGVVGDTEIRENMAEGAKEEAPVLSFEA